MFWIIVSAAAGIGLGSFCLPMKLTKRWKWEHTWAMYAFWALLVAPWVIAFAAVPNLLEVYRQAGIANIAIVCALGTFWGVANITFGLGLSTLGISIGYSLMLGLIIVFGSIPPMVTKSGTDVLSRQNVAIIGGVAVMIISLIINVISTLRKDKEISAQPASANENRSVIKGLIFCVLTGLIAPCLNYAFIYGEPIQQKAVSLGASHAAASTATLPVALFGASLITMIYCGYLINKGRAWLLFVQPANIIYYGFTAFMMIWTFGFALFGVAAINMGKLGHSIGWAVINGSAIICANLIGIFTGEWKAASILTKAIFICGIFVMLVGICIVGWANSLS